MAKLYYFDGRGRGELVRLTLAAANIKFTERIVSERQEFLDLIKEGKLLFEQIPMLEIDGKQIVQTGAIVRYLARKAGLYGKNDEEALRVDEYFEGARDFITPALPMVFQPEAQVLSRLQEKVLPRFLPIFERIAAASGTGFLVGKSMTIADLSLVEALLVFVEYFDKDVLSGYPALEKFFTKVTTQEGIASYLAGPQRKQRNNEHYVNTVKKVLAW